VSKKAKPNKTVAITGGENGPHTGPQRVNRVLQVLEAGRSHWRTSQPRFDLVEQGPERGQLLGQRFLLGHASLMGGS